MKCVIACSKLWNPGIAESIKAKTEAEVHLVTRKEELNFEYLNKLKPDLVFFPHWSFIIPEDIFSRFECVLFHMTDLPFGRGGSPLQNLIARGIYETKISALRCERGLDTGPIYMKRDLVLHGRAEEIYINANQIIENMIVDILQERPIPHSQIGEPVIFKRRTAEDSTLADVDGLEKIYDHIRMLDAPGYPKAYVEVGAMRFEFSHAVLSDDGVQADVSIRLIKK